MCIENLGKRDTHTHTHTHTHTADSPLAPPLSLALHPPVCS